MKRNLLSIRAPVDTRGAEGRNGARSQCWGHMGWTVTRHSRLLTSHRRELLVCSAADARPLRKRTHRRSCGRFLCCLHIASPCFSSHAKPFRFPQTNSANQCVSQLMPNRLSYPRTDLCELHDSRHRSVSTLRTDCFLAGLTFRMSR
jgi:hypothetical protein